MNGITEKAIRDAAPGSVLNDDKIRGLSLRAFEGRKSFYLFYRTKTGVQRRPKLGDWGAMTLTQARNAAREILADVSRGHDPSAIRAEVKAEKTLADLWAEYWKRHGSLKKTADQDEYNWRLHIHPLFAKTKMSDLSYSDVADMMDGMKATPYAANRALALLSTMLNFAVEPLEWIERNPARRVKRFKEEKRKRYMAGEEAARIAEILHNEAQNNPASVAFLYLLILTGARSGEIAKATWNNIQGNKIILGDHKTDRTGDDRVIHLPQAAMDVIDRLPKASDTIVGIQSPKKFWRRVRVEAGCPDLRIHDLRHSFASAALSAGMSLAQIGELLGHRSAQTTHRYAHLVDEVAAASATKVADQILGAMKLALPAGDR